MIDYANQGVTIQQAMLDNVRKSNQPKGTPPKIKWGELTIQTSDCWQVKESGRITIEFLQSDASIEQGVDISVKGWIQVENERVDCLRTWRNEDLEDTVEYDFHCLDGRLFVWNVYKYKIHDRMIESKWTGNAGFWIEHISARERIYHCSHGLNDAPYFSSLIFRVSIS